MSGTRASPSGVVSAHCDPSRRIAAGLVASPGTGVARAMPGRTTPAVAATVSASARTRVDITFAGQLHRVGEVVEAVDEQGG